MDSGSRQLAHRVVLAAIAAVMLVAAWLPRLDVLATQQVDAGLKRALASFATARALNAVISVVQGTEVSVAPGGAGVVLTPGQVLDPVNDLVEKFSTLMLAASVSFGIQKVLIMIGGSWMVAALLTLAVLARVLLYLRQLHPPPWLTSALVVLLMVRFAIPLVTLGSDALFQEFLVGDYQSSQQGIDSASGQIGKSESLGSVTTEANGDQGLVAKLKDWWSRNADLGTRLEKLKQAAEQATDHIIRLIVIFLLQTLVIPLLLLWALYGVTSGALTGHSARR